MSETPDMNLLSEQLDVLIIGAGISGVGAACHLQQQCPDCPTSACVRQIGVLD